MNEKITDKIKKLLRMKRGGTPKEVATAMSLASELAEKYNIDLSAVNPDDEGSGKVTHKDVILGYKVSIESKYSALIVYQFFNVGSGLKLKRL